MSDKRRLLSKIEFQNTRKQGKPDVYRRTLLRKHPLIYVGIWGNIFGRYFCSTKIDREDWGNSIPLRAATLDTVFNELARRAALNIGEHLTATETYLRLAFKAQAQCRSTLETLAEVKYPKAPTFVRQQNVAYQQQVNNGGDSATTKRASPRGKTATQRNELLEAQPGELTHASVPSIRSTSIVSPNCPDAMD